MHDAQPGAPLAAATATAPASSTPAIRPDGAPVTARLRLMCTSDLHMHIAPHDYLTDRPLAVSGLACLAPMIAAARAEAPGALLFDIGDCLQGSALADFIAETRSREGPAPHPMIAAMNALGYDAATLGNHDFNYGLPFLAQALARARFPVVVSNLAPDPRSSLPLPPGLLPERVLRHRLPDATGQLQPLTLGLIGLTPPQILAWDEAHLAGRVVVGDIVTAARAAVARLRAEGCELVIALCHSGIGAPGWTAGMENACVPLAALDGIDAILAGHNHAVFPGPQFAGRPEIDAARGTIHGRPVVMPGAHASHLGLIDLALAREAGVWRVRGFEVEVRPLRALSPDPAPPLPATAPATVAATALPPLALPPGPDPAVLATVAEAHAATRAWLDQPLAQSPVQIDSHFALVAPSRAIRLVAKAQAWHIARRLAGTPLGALPLLSAAAPFRVGGQGRGGHYTCIPPGDITRRHAIDLYAFPNTLRAVRLNGAELRGWLERSAAMFCTLTPGVEDQPLIDPAFPSYNFDVIHGLRYEIDLATPPAVDPEGRPRPGARGRVRTLSHAGKPVTDDAEFVVATSSYRIGSGCPGTTLEHVVLAEPLTNRAALIRYLRAQGGLGPMTPRPDCGWQLAGLGPAGGSALFETAAAADPARAAEADPRIEPAEPLQPGAGTRRFRIRL